MKFKFIKTDGYAVFACSVIISALALTGCSEKTNEQRYESPVNDSTIESNGEGMVSSKDSTASSEEGATSSRDESQSYEVRLDQQLLETVEKERLCVRVYLRMDEEALREEYNEIYPDIGDNSHYWYSFLSNRGEQMLKNFMTDYDINYEDFSVLSSMARIAGELDKDTVSLMLNDPRVSEIYYYPAGFAIMTDRV